MSEIVPFFLRSSTGLTALNGPPTFQPFAPLESVVSKQCKSLLFSSNGDFLAYANSGCITVIHTKSWHCVATIQDLKAYHLAFSPLGTNLATWQPFTVSQSQPNGAPNLKVYQTDTGALLASFVQKKQLNWQPQWSQDEKLICRLINGDLQFFDSLQSMDRWVAALRGQKVISYSLSPTGQFVFCHCLAAASGQPAFGRLYKYPNFEVDQAVVSKGFFQADKIDVIWNAKGSSALLVTSTEVDKTGGSYYGKQSLHFLTTSGQTSMITLPKEGPIHAAAWSPKNHEFCIIYGFMPPKTTVFNHKAEPVFELGTKARNAIHYNPHGNLLLLGGFGNLRGQIEVWNTANWTKCGETEAPDSTQLEWCPDGEHFLTATTAPRLRTANGVKVWHYTGALLYERQHPEGEELYEVQWQPRPRGVFREPVVATGGQKVEGIAPSQPQASKQAYRPPSARNRPEYHVRLCNDEDEQAHRVGQTNQPSKAALKQKKKRENKKANKPIDPAPPRTSHIKIDLTGDPDRDRKLKNLKKKLDAIDKLKREREAGKPLEANQQTKLDSEEALLNELKQLSE